MVSFELPWPPSELSPNRQMHWAKKAKAKKGYKEDCYMLMFGFAVRKKFGKSNIPLKMIFHPPTARSYDTDNLIARMKSGLDGVAMAWGINDKQFRPITADFGPVIKHGLVILTVGEQND